MSQSRACARIIKTALDALDVVTVSRACCEKFYITVHPDKTGDPYAMFDNLAGFVREKNARIVLQDVFGSCLLQADGIRALQRACGPIEWPVTWIEGDSCYGQSLTGTQVYAISGTSVTPIELDGQVIGSVFEDDDASYCLLGDLRPADLSRSKPTQARQVFEKIEEALRFAEMDFSNVIRTWIYIDKLLGWYDEFNSVRTNFFTERKVFEGTVPASTGIGAANPAGAAVVADVCAIKAKTDKVRVRAVPSPLQCPAPDYKSSFSRAVEVVLPDHCRLYISGTASIDPSGKTAHIGDVEKQIALTMEVVQAILESRRMTWSNVSRATAYFRNIHDAPLFDKYCKENRLLHLPVAVAHADICRPDLLYEVEVDAVKSSPPHR